MIARGVYMSSTFNCTVYASARGVESIRFGLPSNKDTAMVGDYAGVDLVERTIEQIDEYMRGLRTDFDLPLNTVALSDFQRAVHTAVRDIPYAHTRSYGEIARRIGQLRASRAVGIACRNNRWPLIIPCHRVIHTSGELGNYRGGPALKQSLIQMERHYVNLQSEMQG